MSREERLEQEKLKKEELIRAEKERKQKYLKEREVRDSERDKMRDKYSIVKPVRVNEDGSDEDDDEEDTFGGPKRTVAEKDSVSKAKDAAVEKLQDATNIVSGLFSGFRR